MVDKSGIMVKPEEIFLSLWASSENVGIERQAFV